jgi:hypothetical protein
MAFQPFGYGFEINSPKSPDAVKSAIRAKKVGWFEPKNGPRGWIAGPLMCLWNSAFDRHGPMVIGRIARDGHGSHIRGRAGSDLNGLVALTIMTPLIVFLLAILAREGSTSPYFYLLLAFFGLGIPATFSLAHTDKREADSLVRFLRRTVEPRTAKSVAQTPPENTESLSARVMDDNGNQLPATGETIKAAIEGLGVDSFVIVEREPERYMQVLSRKTDYVLEKREGSADQHFRLTLPKGGLGETASYDQSERELIAIMTDYLYGRSESRPLDWKLTKV